MKSAMPITDIQNIFHLQKRYSWETKTWPVAHRKDLLRLLFDSVSRREKEICAALAADFQKPELETLITEIYPVLNEIRMTIKHLNRWSRPKRVSSGLMFFGCHSEIRPEAKGTVLIISPWNYPFSLALIPLISALAAGNTIILKPSELTPKTSLLLEEILGEIFQPELVTVIQGEKDTAEELLKLPFSHIFFTGSTPVGKLVMAAASKNLSSVTLELGGKSPTLVHASCDLKLTAQKLVWAKFINSGQTCVAPDYLLIDENIEEALTQALKEEIQKQLNNKIQAHIITPRHQQRLDTLVRDSGAEMITPFLAKNPNLDSALMREEIFGPVLPLIRYKNLDEAIQFINDRPKPLALYIFAKDSDVINNVINKTSSGGVCVNDAIIHLGNHNLPFGGVGESGFGSYHGESGFLAFSHLKSVMKQGLFAKTMTLFYPPYTGRQLKIFRWILKLGL